MTDVAVVLSAATIAAKDVQPVVTTPPSSDGPRACNTGENAAVTAASTPPPRAAVTPSCPAVAVAPAAKPAPAKREGPPPRRVSLWNVVYRRRICGARPLTVFITFTRFAP